MLGQLRKIKFGKELLRVFVAYDRRYKGGVGRREGIERHEPRSNFAHNVADSGDWNGEEDEGSRFSRETKVADTFDGEYENDNDGECGENKKLHGKYKVSSIEKVSSEIFKEVGDKKAEHINDELDKTMECGINGNTREDLDKGATIGTPVSLNSVKNGPEMDSKNIKTDGLDYKDIGDIRELSTTGLRV
ncbi:hypothetical protein Tco_0045999 [Tanacetum coccineum]